MAVDTPGHPGHPGNTSLGYRAASGAGKSPAFLRDYSHRHRPCIFLDFRAKSGAILKNVGIDN